MEIKSLRFEDVSFSHAGQGPLFENVTFDFPMNEMVWVQAEGGQGRSTLLHLLASLAIPQQGRYLINGDNVTDMSFEEFLPYRLKIGYAFDMGGLLHNRTLHENLTLPLFYHRLVPPNEAIKRADRYLERMGVLKHRDKRPAMVPGGVRKIGCLIRALIMHPEVLLLDDPTVGISRDIYLQYFDLVSDLRSAGHLRHIFMSSFDTQLLTTLKPKRVAIDNKAIHHFEPEGEKKVVNL